MTKYHRTENGRLLVCRENKGKCPYGGPVPSYEDLKRRKHSTKQECYEANLAEEREVKVAPVKEKVRVYQQKEKELVDKFFTEEEKRRYEASKVLYNYDNSKAGKDDDTNKRLYYLSIAHPEEFHRLSLGFKDIKTAAERKQAIKECYEFYEANPSGVYTNFPHRNDVKRDKNDSTLVAFFKTAEASGDATLQRKLEYLYRNHPDKVEELVKSRDNFASDEVYEVYLTETYNKWEAKDRSFRGRLIAKSKSGRFGRVANAMYTLFKKLTVTRDYLEDGALTKGKSKPKEGQVVGGDWVLSKGYFYHRNADSSIFHGGDMIELLERARRNK